MAVGSDGTPDGLNGSDVQPEKLDEVADALHDDKEVAPVVDSRKPMQSANVVHNDKQAVVDSGKPMQSANVVHDDKQDVVDNDKSMHPPADIKTPTSGTVTPGAASVASGIKTPPVRRGGLS